MAAHRPQALADGASRPVSTNVIRQSWMSVPQQLDRSAAVGQDEVVRQRLVVPQEVVLDDIGLVAEAEHEVLVPEVRVVPHDVPQDRPVADRHHRLGQRLGVFPQAEPLAAAEQHDLHDAAAVGDPAWRRRRPRRSAAPGWPRRAVRPTLRCPPAGRRSPFRFQGRIQTISGPDRVDPFGRMDRDSHARREPAVLVRVPVDGEGQQVRPDPAVVEERVGLARGSVAGHGRPASRQARSSARTARLSAATRAPNAAYVARSSRPALRRGDHRS